MVIVGHKSDAEEERAVTTDEGQKVATVYKGEREREREREREWEKKKERKLLIYVIITIVS